MLFAQNPAVDIVSRKMVRVDNGDGTFDRFDIAKMPWRSVEAGWYPVELTGSGSMPDVSALSFDGSKYTGAYVPVAPSRIETLLAFSDRFTDDDFFPPCLGNRWGIESLSTDGSIKASWK